MADAVVARVRFDAVPVDRVDPFAGFYGAVEELALDEPHQGRREDPPGVLGFERPHLKFAAVVEFHLAVEELELMRHVRLLAELCRRASLMHLLGGEIDLAAE